MKKSSREKGTEFEQKAVSYLRRQGYRILEKNFYSRYGEIDLVAMDGRYLCFIEVKYRETTGKGDPLEAVDLRKQRRICKTALFYLIRKGYPDTTACRFDVIGITPEKIELIKNAFPYRP